jgi:hypothetical protein
VPITAWLPGYDYREENVFETVDDAVDALNAG